MASVRHRAERGHIGWTRDDKSTSLAEKLIYEGKTVAEIANAVSAQFGSPVTRNAVIGFAWRKGLSIGKSNGPAPVRKIKPTKAIKDAPPRERVKEPPPRPPPIRYGNPKRKTTEEPTKAAATLPPQPASGNFFTIKEGPDADVCFPPLGTCRWIEGGVREGRAFMCADPVRQGSSYCPHHHARVLVPAPKYEPRVTERRRRISEKNPYILQVD